jgi:nucleoside-diphosphate-sugar epimerase
MSRVLVTGGSDVVGSRVILRLLTAGREVRTTAGSPTPAAEVRAQLDAVAGCEYVDDRIRRPE